MSRNQNEKKNAKRKKRHFSISIFTFSYAITTIQQCFHCVQQVLLMRRANLIRQSWFSILFFVLILLHSWIYLFASFLIHLKMMPSAHTSWRNCTKKFFISMLDNNNAFITWKLNCSNQLLLQWFLLFIFLI